MVTRTWFPHLLLGALACATAGCDDDPEPLEPAAWLPPVVLEGHLALIDGHNDRIHLVDVRAPDAPDVAQEELPENPVWADRRAAHTDELLVLASGLRGAQPGATLSVIDDRAGRRTFDLEAPFNRVVQSDDGQFAVAYYERGSRDPLFSPNRIAVIDLDSEDRSDGVTHTTLRTPNGTLDELLVSPELRMGDLRAHLAIGMSAGYLSLLDLANPKRADILVELGDARVVPRQIAFSPNAGHAYVRAEGSDDVFIVRIGEADEGRENDFWPTIDQVAVAPGFEALTVAGDGSNDRLFAVSAREQELHVVDRVAGRTHRIDLGRSATELMGLAIAGDEDEDEDEDDRAPLAYALAFTPGESGVTLIAGRDLPGRGTDALTELTTALPVSSAIALEDQGRVLLHHAGAPVVSVVDVRAARLQPLSLTEALSSLLVDERFETLLVAPRGSYQVGTTRLRGGETRADLLDAPVAHAAVTADDQIAVLHPDDTLTLIDLSASNQDLAARTFDIR